MDMKRILQAMDGVATKPVEGANDMKKFLSVVTEGSNPHKVALPVQMAMQHYQQPAVVKKKPKLLEKYFTQVEQEQLEEEKEKQQLIKQYSQTIAERVLMKEDKDPCWDNYKMVGTKKKGGKQVPNCVPKEGMDEAPIEPTADANDPVVYGHEKANPMSLKGRISQARAQLQELAKLADSDDLVVWEKICRLSKGGMFMGLEQNLEQIRHGIGELAAKRKQGGIASRGIDKNIG